MEYLYDIALSTDIMLTPLSCLLPSDLDTLSISRSKTQLQVQLMPDAARVCSPYILPTVLNIRGDSFLHAWETCGLIQCLATAQSACSTPATYCHAYTGHNRSVAVLL